MKHTSIKFSLSEREIDRAIRELEQHKNELVRLTSVLREKVASRIQHLAQSGFNGAIVDDLLKGGVKTAQVTVSISNDGNMSLVIANGEDAVWVEFGTGVYHNGAHGTSPHPNGVELGFTIGDFGKGLGKRNAWGYYDEDALVVTRGAPASMPMFTAVRIVCDEIASLAREVFG